MKAKELEKLFELMTKYKISHVKIDGYDVTKSIHKQELDEFEDVKPEKQLTDDEILFHSSGD